MEEIERIKEALKDLKERGLYDYILHETESIRFRRSIHGED